MSRPKIYHLVYSLIRGGTEGQCARVALALAEDGWRQRVGVFAREGALLPVIEEAVGEVDLVPIRSLRSPGTWWQVWRLSRRLKQGGIELLHAWDADAVVFGSMAARAAGIPWITSRRDMGELYPGWKLSLVARADRGAGAVVINAEAIRPVAEGGGVPPGRVVRVPNMLDVVEFDAIHAKPCAGAHSLPDRPCVVSVARLDPEKDMDCLLRAACALRARLAGVHWLVVGEGRERARLQAEATRLGLHDTVFWLGEIHDVPAVLRHVDVGVLTPKSNEGLSNSILEYMAAGLPSVVTDCGGNRELVVNGETGAVVPAGDSEAVAGALASLLRDPARARAMGRAAREKLVSAHDKPVVAAQFARLYEKVGIPSVGFP